MFNTVKKLNPSIIKPIAFATNRAILLNKLKVISQDENTGGRYKPCLSYFSMDSQ